MSDEIKEEKIVIPYEKLSSESLDGVMSDFILREGTDYGQEEYSLEQKKEQVLRQLKTQDIFVVFDQLTESSSILTKHELK